ncbi:ribonuclease H [bacterium]|nr:ribonuclease HI family protein [bacterium]MEC7925453.1 ribonuclease HI family protein [Thermodesulfobacteriota bacterium]GIR28782.1 MAG: ribonuclease H [bacterium]|tara:strand:+ start:349 stop:756 length:408 start_codon:yes stop_codon:yes gene_type:complete
MNDYLKIFIDGACQPNPGNGGIGVFIDSEEINEEISFSLPGIVTNNIAEYEALIFALDLILKKYSSFKQIRIFSDSKLVCMQFNKKWKCKDNNLKSLLEKAHAISSQIPSEIILTSIPREENKVADELAKNGIRN